MLSYLCGCFNRLMVFQALQSGLLQYSLRCSKANLVSSDPCRIYSSRDKNWCFGGKKK